jgi:hypothetical protein
VAAEVFDVIGLDYDMKLSDIEFEIGEKEGGQNCEEVAGEVFDVIGLT